MATETIPIVVTTPDPIAMGLVTSIARPGGNITGVSLDGGLEIYGKRIGLLIEAIPKLSKVGYLVSRRNWENSTGDAAREAAARIGISLKRNCWEAPSVRQNTNGYSPQWGKIEWKRLW
jgi:putative ABC transport system substrate-binding protein